jgi:hypothetical protein
MLKKKVKSLSRTKKRNGSAT